jgi:hypothetical protein
MKICQHRAGGTITVFLSLILILILSLLCTIIEGARVSTAKVYAERALTTAMDSVLAEYYGPLWEEYHIFGYNAGNDGETQQDLRIATALSDYMSYTFSPDKDLEGIFHEGGAELYDISVQDLRIKDKTDLLDYEGQLLINQAVEYMKYKEIGNGIESLLDKLSLLETPNKVSYIMEKKQEVEEELVEIDKGILELMELYDGLETSNKGIELAKDGSIKTTGTFIKKLCFDEATMDTVGINNEILFEAQKDRYVNPNTYFQKIDSYFNNLIQISKQLENLLSEKEALNFQLADEQEALEALNSMSEKSEEDEQQIKEIKQNIKNINSSIEELEDRIKEQSEQKASLVSSITAESDTISQLIMEIKPLINTALSSLDKIIVRTEVAGPLLEQYEDFLISQKEGLSEEGYQGLEEGLNELKQYAAADENGYNFTGMKAILENNLIVLAAAQDKIKKAKEELVNESYLSAKASFETAGSTLKDYRISGLTLDYSTLTYDKSNQKTPLNEMTNLLQSGLTGLVLDPDSLSDAELSVSELFPSEIAAMAKEDTDFLKKLTAFFNGIIIGGENSGIGSLFEGFGNGTQLADLVEEGVNSLAEKLLFQEYLKEHFGKYQPAATVNAAQKPSVLSYEQEYLLVGKTSDRENIASIITRIIFLRMIFDFVSVLGDKTIRTEARLVAASLVGFTGLPVLVSITQALILLIWSFAEALLDTTALMMGKEVPIIKKHVAMTFPELFLLSREYLKQKASSMADTQKPAFSYRDYLGIFLLLKSREELTYRSMDLIQENLRLRYDTDTFRIKNCLYGYEAEAVFAIEEKFTGFAFLHKYINFDKGGFEFTIKAGYSY